MKDECLIETKRPECEQGKRVYITRNKEEQTKSHNLTKKYYNLLVGTGFYIYICSPIVRNERIFDSRTGRKYAGAMFEPRQSILVEGGVGI